MSTAEILTDAERKVPRTAGRQRQMVKAKVRRLSINLPDKTFAELERLADESGRTLTEVIRLAIGLAQVAIDEESHDRKLAVIEPNGKLLKELVLLR
jgi:predicted DNA-binding protein